MDDSIKSINIEENLINSEQPILNNNLTETGITDKDIIPLIDDDYDDDESIRLPDSVFNDKLIQSIESDDDEMNLALEVSRNVYLSENNLYNDTYIGTQLKLAIDISLEEETNKLEEIAKNESILLEFEIQRNLEINNRKKSLEEFIKRIKFIENIEIKSYIKNILNDYFNLNIDFIYLKKDIHEQIYKIIDSYYLIPVQKKYKKTGISENEDIILRKIFLISSDYKNDYLNVI
jgi:hypothetical protein